MVDSKHPPLSEPYFYDCSASGVGLGSASTIFNIENKFDYWFGRGFLFQERHIGNAVQSAFTKAALYQRPRICPIYAFGSFMLVDIEKFEYDLFDFSWAWAGHSQRENIRKLTKDQIISQLQQPQHYINVTAKKAALMLDAFVKDYERGWGKNKLKAFLNKNADNLGPHYRHWLFNKEQYPRNNMGIPYGAGGLKNISDFVMLTDQEVNDVAYKVKPLIEKDAKPWRDIIFSLRLQLDSARQKRNPNAPSFNPGKEDALDRLAELKSKADEAMRQMLPDLERRVGEWDEMSHDEINLVKNLLHFHRVFLAYNGNDEMRRLIRIEHEEREKTIAADTQKINLIRKAVSKFIRANLTDLAQRAEALALNLGEGRG